MDNAVCLKDAYNIQLGTFDEYNWNLLTYDNTSCTIFVKKRALARSEVQRNGAISHPQTPMIQLKIKCPKALYDAFVMNNNGDKSNVNLLFKLKDMQYWCEMICQSYIEHGDKVKTTFIGYRINKFKLEEF